MINFKSFRFRLLSHFLIFIFFSVLISSLVYYFGSLRENIMSISDQLMQVHVKVTQAAKTQQDFYTYESKNSNYFKTGESEYKDDFLKLIVEIDESLMTLQNLDYYDDFQLKSRIEAIRDEWTYNKKLFRTLDSSITRRGFKDYGIEGQMRKFVHNLEQYPEIVEPSELLTLRRHEKDFILRNDSIYICKLHKTVESIVLKIKQREKISKPLVHQTLLDLDNYKDLFNVLATLEFEIGLNTNTGLIGQLNQANTVLNSYFIQTAGYTIKMEDKLLHELYYYFAAIYVLVILFGLRLTFLLSKKVTLPLSFISSSLTQFVVSNFSKKSKRTYVDRNDEIGKLATNISILENEIFDQINFFNQKVLEKTAEIQQQNDRIKDQNKEIEWKNEELQLQNVKIEAQKLLVEDHNQRLLDSIHYAKRIQTTILPDQDEVNRILPNYFIYYQPKDIVSGDFYWVNAVENKKSKRILIGAIDCTGHGVPGAFMSVLGYTTLNDALRDNPDGTPSDLLNYLHHKVYQIFNRNGSKAAKLHDGMDLALISISSTFKDLQFAGAYNSVYIVRKKSHMPIRASVVEEERKIVRDEKYELHEFKGDRYAIGHHESHHGFANNTIKIRKGDRVYLSTDGYPDQFGGSDSRRFQKKRFKSMLLDIQTLDMNAQLDEIKSVLKNWKGNEEQIDDICVIGIEIP